MIGRKDENGPQFGSGINEEQAPCLNTTDRHAVCHTVYDLTQITSPQNGSNPQPGFSTPPLVNNGHPLVLVEQKCFQQNQREEVRFMSDDGNISGALKAHEGTHNQNYVLSVNTFTPAHYIRGFGPHGLSGTLKKIPNDSSSHVIQEIPTESENGNGNDRLVDTLTALEQTRPCDLLVISHYITLIRRLTPLECERLQGFPDNYTRIPLDAVEVMKLKGIDGKEENIEYYSDSKRYSALGNSMTTNVMHFLGKRIDIVDKALKEINKTATHD